MAAGPTSYDPATALVVLDVQNDFAHPDGNLYVSGGEQIIPAINAEVAAARSGGAFVVYTQDWHPETTPHFEKDGGIWPTHCVQETWGAAFHADLEVDGPVVQKGTGGEDGYSGFTVEHPATGERQPTDLDTLLRERAVSTLVVVGLCQDVCVKDTVLDAARLGYRVSVLTAATRPVNLHPGDGEAALRTMADVGAQIVDA
jgi:nicotinamidase/pyrazinamidase